MEKLSIKSKSKVGIILFLLPIIILFTAFFLYPIGFLLVTSFYKWDGLSAPTLVGIKNYLTLFNDPVFRLSIKNNIGWLLAGGFIQIPLATLVAILLARKPKGWEFLRTVYYFPNVISIVAISIMWMAIYNSGYGALNGLLKLVGLANLQRNWLGDLHLTYPAVVLYGVFYIGYFMIIILAEISSIPKQYYEVASIDGATRFQQELYITLPLIKNSICTCMIIAMVYGLRQFEQTYIMTNGGPANKTMVMVLYLFKKMHSFRYGLASTSGIILLIMGVFVIVGVRKLFKVEKYEM